MISEFYIVTTAESNYETHPDLAKKATGTPVKLYNIESIIFHPDYQPGYLDNDVALAKIDNEFNYHGYSKLICLNFGSKNPEDGKDNVNYVNRF